MEFSDRQLERYARHIVLPEVGGKGQEKLLASSVLVVGAGGLGSPLLLYLAASGVGRIGVVDDDAVDLSNLQRQVIHATGRIGQPKVESARDAVAAVNPDVAVEAHAVRLGPANVMDLIAPYDIVADGSDNFPTRFLLNDACYFARKPLVSGALLRFEGQVSTFKAYDGESPCYRCIFPGPPPEGLIPTCAEGGVLGAVAGVIGCLQATEVIKELIGIGEGLAGRLLVMDALTATFRRITVRRDPACPLCGDRPSITDLSGHGG
ncbi:MAG TPA: molybdopterin-synthase adenylyltransferase MoeB [Alphaproteobacteria bacterium]|jgi:adenylyltransferase/sulfurtransferase